MEKIVYLWDPRSPWCHATTRWVERLAELGEIELEFGLFSIELVNLKESEGPKTFRAQYGPVHRTATLVRRRFDAQTMGAFCSAVAKSVWERDAPAGWSPENLIPSPSMLDTSRDALEAIGLDRGLVDEAMSDQSTWDEVVDEFAKWKALHVFGVGSLVFNGGEGPMTFGPVIGPLPDDETCREIWRHASWLVHHGYVFEVKKYRRPGDQETMELPSAPWRGALRSANMRDARAVMTAEASQYKDASLDYLIAKVYWEKEEARSS